MKKAGLWVAAMAAITIVIFVASGEKDEPAPAPPPITAIEREAPPKPAREGRGAEGKEGQARRGNGRGGGAGGTRPDRTRSGREVIGERIARDAERTYRAYVEAINARDGEALCELLAPGFLAELRPAERRDDCAATMRASIGYEDPRRFPVWEQTVLTGFEQIEAKPGTGGARVTAAVITRFADRTEPSVESDIAYLGPIGGEMRLLKASGVLWRALGKPDYPPTVISPP